MTMANRILVVEDDSITRELLLHHLEQAGYQTTGAEDGESAWQTLQQAPDEIIAILLDRRLPGIDGMEVLRRIKSDPALSHVPVIMQTGLGSHEEILQGLRAGAHYYLTKPFSTETVVAIVDTAVADFSLYLALRRESRQAGTTLKYLDQAAFRFRTRSEAQDIATLLANVTADAQRVVLGLTELMLNAVEHGNLGIRYEEKSQLIAAGQLDAELERRHALPDYADRVATVSFQRHADHLWFCVQDQGEGFDWRPYLEISPERACDTHGRGIALARQLSFDQLEYQGNGNRVVAMVRI